MIARASRPTLHRSAARPLAAPLLLLVLALALAVPAPALITVGRGSAPVADAGWPLGALDLANLKTRVGWYEGPPFGGGEWCFLYRGDAAALNEALKAMGAVRAPRVEVVLHDGPENCHFLADPRDPNADTRIDWSFTVWVPANWHRLYNDPRSTFTAAQKNFRGPVAPPRLDVYITPKIDWRQVKVPDGIQVTDERVAANAGANPPRKGATIRGDVFDMATGKPIISADLRVQRNPGKGNRWEDVKSAASDATGRFALVDIPPGNYRVVASATGYAPRMLGYEQLKDGAARKLTVELSRAARFTGTVTDADGRPVPGVTVRTSNTMGIDGRGYAPPDAPETRTDAQGHFVLADLPAGYLQGWAHAPGYFHVDGLKLYALPDPTSVVLRVVATGSIRGKVVDKTGRPTSGGSVNVAPPGDPIGKWGGSMNAAADGTFEFKDVPPGPYTVSTRPQLPGLPKDPSAVSIEVISGKVAEVTVAQ